MTVSELIEELKKMPQDARIELAIANPKDTAFSNAEVRVAKKENGVTISAFVWSDDENTYAPWAHRP